MGSSLSQDFPKPQKFRYIKLLIYDHSYFLGHFARTQTYFTDKIYYLDVVLYLNTIFSADTNS